MSEELLDFEALSESLRHQLLRAVGGAVARLAGAAGGREVFNDDRELRACIALARLVPVVLRDVPEKEYDRYEDPAWWTEERKEDYRILTGEEFDMKTASKLETVCYSESVGPEMPDEPTSQEMP